MTKLIETPQLMEIILSWSPGISCHIKYCNSNDAFASLTLMMRVNESLVLSSECYVGLKTLINWKIYWKEPI